MNTLLPLLLALAADPAKGPTLQGAPKTYDFGVIHSVPQVWEWKVTNSGDAPLSISAPGCECARIGFKLPDTDVPAGENAAVAFTLKLEPTRYGEGVKSVFLATNDPGQPKITLTAKWDYQPPAICSPPGVRFGDVPAGAGRESYITVLSLDPTFTIEKLESSSSMVTFEPANDDAPSDKPNYPGRKVFVARLNKDAPTGLIDAKLTLRVMAAPTPGAAPVAFEYDSSISANVRSELVIHPGAFRPPPVAGGTAFDAPLTLTSSNGTAFKITNVRLVEGGIEDFASQLEPIEGGGWKVTLRGTAPSEPGLHRYSVEVTTDLPREAPMNVALQVMVKR